MPRFRGLIAAPFTPMDAQTALDLSVVDLKAGTLLD
jgi:hypothetical protein